MAHQTIAVSGTHRCYPPIGASRWLNYGSRQNPSLVRSSQKKNVIARLHGSAGPLDRGMLRYLPKSVVILDSQETYELTTQIDWPNHPMPIVRDSLHQLDDDSSLSRHKFEYRSLSNLNVCGAQFRKKCRKADLVLVKAGLAWHFKRYIQGPELSSSSCVARQS
jgi:hypothetical protein